MAQRFKETFNTLLEGMEGFVAAKTVVGEPIHAGDAIIIPLTDVSFGLGAGSFGKEKDERDGGGVGGKMSPCAVLIIQNGITKLVNVRTQDGITKVLDMVPDIVNRFTSGGTEEEKSGQE